MRVILIPGWNEAADDLQCLVGGRHGHPGFAAFGYECSIFDGGQGSMHDRIGQLREFLERQPSGGPGGEGFGLFGYSAGGLLARGLLRSQPVPSVRSIFQLATPNAGVVTDGAAAFFARLHFSRSALADIDVESEFVRWLNATPGHWESDARGDKRWTLDADPWVVPDGVPIAGIAGRVPRYRRSDGVVLEESATLNDRVAHEFVSDPQANHLNLAGTWNPLTTVLRGWRADDRIWPGVVARAAAFFSEPAGAPR